MMDTPERTQRSSARQCMEQYKKRAERNFYGKKAKRTEWTERRTENRLQGTRDDARRVERDREEPRGDRIRERHDHHRLRAGVPRRGYARRGSGDPGFYVSGKERIKDPRDPHHARSRGPHRRTSLLTQGAGRSGIRHTAHAWYPGKQAGGASSAWGTGAGDGRSGNDPEAWCVQMRIHPGEPLDRGRLHDRGTHTGGDHPPHGRLHAGCLPDRRRDDGSDTDRRIRARGHSAAHV